jgi:N-glycosylase/DNA lyase
MHRLSRHYTPALATLPLPGHFGSEAEENDISEYTTYHLFPRPHDLLRQSHDPAKPEETEDRLQQTLRELGFGYRAGFISSSVRTLVLAHGRLRNARCLAWLMPMKEWILEVLRNSWRR